MAMQKFYSSTDKMTFTLRVTVVALSRNVSPQPFISFISEPLAIYKFKFIIILILLLAMYMYMQLLNVVYAMPDCLTIDILSKLRGLYTLVVAS